MTKTSICEEIKSIRKYNGNCNLMTSFENNIIACMYVGVLHSVQDDKGDNENKLFTMWNVNRPDHDY